MNAIQDRCRPKHQVLVLKCYPRIRKGAVDVKPNSSELSYLLFYATSRRSKIHKIGAFLEKKTASDVWRVRIGNVQVTLQILAALIEKSPKDLPLIASCVLRVLDLILESGDVTMVESSLPTFEAFCENHDPTSLFADQGYVKQYEAVVRSYANFASTKHTPSKGSTSKPVVMRWRNAGLEAIRSVISSDALSSLAGRQLEVIVPIILENLWSDNDDFLEALALRIETDSSKVEPEKVARRRTSIATVRTADTAGDTNPIALSGTALDADKLAEEDISVLALQCLKRTFVIPNRSQIHSGTQALLAFIEERLAQGEKVMSVDSRPGEDRGWAIQVYDLIARWASVQDRYMILFTSMDALVRIPLKDETLHRHLVLAAMIGSLLRSDINLIGLSVMDVLLQLIQQMRKLLLLPSLSENGGGSKEEGSPPTAENKPLVESQRAELLGRIERCIGDLATHVYYADQVPDMVSTILHRLKPRRSSSTSSSPRLEQEGDAAEGADQTHHAEAYFSFNAAKISALKAVKSILIIANPPSRAGENRPLSRHRVPIQVWEGTHWLLRDPDGEVRKSYVDALRTWLDRETTRADFKVQDDTVPQRPPLKPNRDAATAAFARRAASSTSQDRTARAARSRFLQLLHIAIYDNALQYLDYESDYVLLHALLLKLVARLGVNTVRFGLPMIYRLQEDIQDAETPTHKVRLGSLVHGYFWILTEVFDFDGSSVGRAIINEVVRRRSKQFWVDGVTIPSPSMERIETPGATGPQRSLSRHEIESESLMPFDDRFSLVECVAAGYHETSVSPAASPGASPGRSFTQPVLNSAMSTGSIAVTAPESTLPDSYRERMLGEWNREQAMLALHSGSKSDSLSGSKTGTTGTHKHRLGVNGSGPNGHHVASPTSPSPRGSQHNLRAASVHAAGSNGNLAAPAHALRKSSVRSEDPSGSSRGYVASINQLKQVLTGEATAPMPGTAGPGGDSDSDDSMVSYEGSPSELSFSPESRPSENRANENRPSTADGSQPQTGLQRRPSKGKSVGPLTSNPTHDESQEGVGSSPEPERVPPVPPLPQLRTKSLSRRSEDAGDRDRSPVASPTRALHSRGGDRALKSSGGRRLASRGGESMRVSSMAESTGGVDLQELLRAVDSRSGEASLGNLTRPPY